jgi:hypothetical protein
MIRNGFVILPCMLEDDGGLFGILAIVLMDQVGKRGHFWDSL